MALTFTANGVDAGTIFVLSIIGDGVSNTINIDLTDPPFPLSFKGNEPVGFASTNFGDNPGTITISKTTVTIAFDVALALNQNATVTFQLAFAGV
jgi:hypothetical protein